MTIARIQFLTVPVSDRAKARDFYVGDLDHDARVHLQLTTAEMPWGRVASLKDPDGNGIGLLEPSGYGNWPR